MLVHVTVAFLSGLLLGSFFPFTPLLCIACLILAAFGFTWLVQSGRLNGREGSILYAGLLAGLLYWTAWAWLNAPVPLSRLAGNAPAAITGQVVGPVHYAPERVSFHLAASRLNDVSTEAFGHGTLRVTWREPDRDVQRGDLVTLLAKVSPPSGQANPGGFDYAAYLVRHGIDATVSVSGPQAVRWVGRVGGISRWPLWHLVDAWRDRIRHAAIASLHDSALGLYLGMVIGQPGYIVPDVRDAFMATGTVHILSISGSHLSLVGLLSFFLIKQACRCLPARWLLRLSRRITSTQVAALGTAVPVTVYGLLAGAEVATVRSWLMIMVFLLAVWLGRQERLLLSLACAALVIVLQDPRALYDISFQLSYGSVLAIALVLRAAPEEARDGLPPIRRIRDRVGAWLTTYARITGGVSIATLPLVAYHFNQVAWLGLAANLLVVPLAGLVLVPLGLGSALWVAAAGSETLPAAALNQAGFEFLSDLVHMLARVPGAEWHVASPALVSIALFYGLFLMAMGRQAPHRIRFACLAGALVLAGWWIASPRDRPQDDTLRVTFLDVGQGDAAAIELPDGTTILIDAGARHDTLDFGRSIVAPFLWNRGIARLDHVIATHPQLDHIGGLPAVLRHFPVGRFWSNGQSRREPFYHELQETLHQQGLSESVAGEGHTIVETRTCRLSVLNPATSAQVPPLTRGDSGNASNNQSVVTRLVCGPHSFLFAADAEAAALARLTTVESSSARILKVPHHGARSSLDERWIRHVAPEIAVISVGRRNPYGHPTQAVLRTYGQQGSRIFRTDRDGAVSISAHLSSPTYEVSLAREAMLAPVQIGTGLLQDERANWLRLRHQLR